MAVTEESIFNNTLYKTLLGGITQSVSEIYLASPPYIQHTNRYITQMQIYSTVINHTNINLFHEYNKQI